MRRIKRNFLKQCKKGRPRAKFARLEPEKANNLTAYQKLYEKMAVHQGNEDKQCDRKTTSKTKKLSLENKEEQLETSHGNTGKRTKSGSPRKTG